MGLQRTSCCGWHVVHVASVCSLADLTLSALHCVSQGGVEADVAATEELKAAQEAIMAAQTVLH